MGCNNLLYVGLLLVLVAVGYQYRNELTLLAERVTRGGEENSESKAATGSKASSKPDSTSPDSSLETSSSSNYFNPPFDPSNPPAPLFSEAGTRMITLNELAVHGPQGPLAPIWLAVLGRVYDVDKGNKYYGSDGGYNFFAGIDGSRAFVTGEFNEEGLTDDLEGLNPMEVGEVDGWTKFYDKEYTFVGKLIGRYYTQEGDPTKEWYKIQKVLSEKEKMEAERKEMQKRFPPCNSNWNKEEGGMVFCSDKSGGIHRDWVGFPRRYFAPGSKSWRCSCVREEDLSSPHVKHYPDCDPTSIRCKVDSKKIKKMRERGE